MARRMSPYQRGWEAGFAAGWSAREQKSADAWAESLLTIKPADIVNAERRIAQRAQRPAGDTRVDFPGLSVMRAEVAHRAASHLQRFELCPREPCDSYDERARSDALAFRAQQEAPADARD